MAKPKQNPRRGAIVLYRPRVAAEDDPAIIRRVHEDGTVDLVVFELGREYRPSEVRPAGDDFDKAPEDAEGVPPNSWRFGPG